MTGGLRAKLEVRPARAEDLAAIYALERSEPTAPHWAEREYRAMIEGQMGAVWRRLLVADVDGRLAGFAVGRMVGERPDREAELESVAVQPELRRGGIGQALLAAVLAWCRAKGARTVNLEVRAGSEGAQRLYAGAGFQTIGQRKAYYARPEEDAVLMRLVFAAEPDGRCAPVTSS